MIAKIIGIDFGSTIAGADYLHPHNYQVNMGRNCKDIIEVSTMKPSTGIPWVVVNATVVVRDSRVLRDVSPGKAIRLAQKAAE